MEKAVKFLFIFSQILVTLTYAFAWKQAWVAELFKIPVPFQLHLWMGLTSLFLSLFANLCVIFYFVGSGVWIKDRSKETYRSEKEKGQKIWKLYENANRLKGKGFPFPTFALALGLFTFILGGALHVGAVPAWLHPSLATLWLLVSWGGLKLTFKAIDANLVLLNETSDLIESPI